MDKTDIKAARRAADKLWAVHKSYGKIAARPFETPESWAAKWLKALHIDDYADFPKKSRTNF